MIGKRRPNQLQHQWIDTLAGPLPPYLSGGLRIFVVPPLMGASRPQPQEDTSLLGLVFKDAIRLP